MLLAPYAHSPKTVTLPTAAAGVAPFPCKINPFLGGNMVTAVSSGAGFVVGASINRNTALKHLKFVVAAADVTPAANVVGQTAAAREADGDVSGDLTVTLGSAGGQILDALGACADVAVPADNMTVIVTVNGKVYSRINDAAAPNPGVLAWGKDSDVSYILVIGASTGADVIKVGSLVEVFVGMNIGLCAERDATGLIAGTALVAGLPEERFLGVVAASVDTAGRSTVQLVASDFVMALTAPVGLVGTTL